MRIAAATGTAPQRRAVAILAMAVLALWHAWATAQTPTAGATPPAATLSMIRTHQVWRDELPDRLDAGSLEVVILSPDSRCRPPLQKGLMGITVNPLDPVTGMLCRRLEAFVQAPPEPLPFPVRVATPATAVRQASAVLAALEPAPSRRHVALVHWEGVPRDRDIAWLFEIVVIDRDAGRVVWHGARGHEVWPRPEWLEKTTLRALGALLLHELPRDLLDRAWWRDNVPVPGSRWVPPDEIARYQPAADRAGLVVVNSYYGSNRLQDDAVLKLWPAGTPEVDETAALRALDWRRSSTLRRAQSTPLLAPDTYALLDLPAGDYDLRPYTSVERQSLAPGQISVLNIQRGLGNVKTVSRETPAWWREKVLGGHGRHAFYAEPPARGRPSVVPHFIDAAP